MLPETGACGRRLAWLLLEMNRPQEALPYFQELAASGAEDKNISLGLAVSYLKVQQPEHAIQTLNSSLAYHPDDPVLMKLKGEALLCRLETAPQAWQLFTRLAQKYPDNTEWRRRQEEASRLAAKYYYQSALRELKAGNTTAALEALQESVRFDAQNSGYRTHYGWALGNAGQWDRASQEFQKVLQKDPEKKDAYLGLAQARLSTKDYAGAREAAQEGMSHFPDDPGLLTLLGEALAADAATKKDAVGIYERLTVLEPQNDKAAVRLARLDIELGDLNAAERILKAVLARTPDYAPAEFSLGQLNFWADAYGLAAENFRQVLNQEPENQEARQDLEKSEKFLRPQFQVQAGYFEDSETFHSSYIFTGSRFYVTPTLLAETGYGYLDYTMGNNPWTGRTLERAAHRHVLPLVFYYRPTRRLTLEVGGAFNDYGVWGTTGNAQASIFYQVTPQTGLSLSYSFHDIIDYYGPFKGPYGRMLDDFAEFDRYRYLVIDPVSLWSSNIFGASSTQAIIHRIQAHSVSFWGYQNFLSRLTLSVYGSLGFLTDSNDRSQVGTTLACRIFQDPLVKIKYSFFYIDYRSASASLAGLPSWSAPLYWDPQGFKNHSFGLVFEQNWMKKFKLALETDMLFNQGTADPGFLGLAEMDYLVTSNVALRIVGSYLNSNDQGNRQSTSYQAKNIFGGLSYRF